MYLTHVQYHFWYSPLQLSPALAKPRLPGKFSKASASEGFEGTTYVPLNQGLPQWANRPTQPLDALLGDI